MVRDEMISRIKEMSFVWDIIIIGGGATGLGTAVEAASSGFSTLLLEQHDFAQGTSSRSTKLIHGGIRYLQQGNISLVLEALYERGILLLNAPHLVHHQSLVVPNYEWWEGPFYGIGLKIYDVLAGKLGLNPSKWLSLEETLARIPTIEPKGLRGGIMYYDGQFDDARLAITLARTAVELGGCVVNYAKVVSLLKDNRIISGVIARDEETSQEYEIKGKVVINAAGIFVDSIRQMDTPGYDPVILPSQGVHLVLDKTFLPGKSAIMVPHTDDGRVLFAVPWNERVIIGTTDTPIKKPTIDPRPFPDEIEFLLSHAAKYLTKDPAPSDVLSVFAGIRPLVNTSSDQTTASLSRDHHVLVSHSGLVTIAGGKWTTYRKMGEDTIDTAISVADLDKRISRTEKLHLYGWSVDSEKNRPFSVYGEEAGKLKTLMQTGSDLDKLIHPALPYRYVEVIWALRYEMARTLTDILARRTRALILDARASMEIAPKIAAVMAVELGKDKSWEEQQVKSFLELAKNYIIA